VHGKKITYEKATVSTRTLGVYINPSLCWKSQFEVMKRKLQISITKLVNTDINPYQAALYYNAYMIKSVYFGCGIVDLSEKQEIALQQIYEEPLLVKLGLSRKFPRDVLYSRKSALGIGIMKPSTIIDTLKAKLYLGNVQRAGVAQSAIRLQEEYLAVEAGRGVSIPYNPEDRYWQRLWIDEVNDLFYKRQLNLHNYKYLMNALTKNETIMDIAQRYARIKQLNVKEMRNINFVRIKKKLLLPCELVGMSGKKPTEYYDNINEVSQIDWGFFPDVEDKITRN